ncbi:MAG: NlpC/P60 family protein [Ethanoligenens sp.]
MSQNTPRLKFTDEDRADPALQNPIRKAEKAASKANRAQVKIPKKTVKMKARTVDPKTGKVTVRLHFEEEIKKPPSKLAHAVRDAPGNLVAAQFHREIRQSEGDNAGVEAAHRTEQAAETSVRAGRSIQRAHKLKPYREAVKAEKRLDKANLGFLQQKAAQENPQLASNPFSRWQQRQAIKREYAAAKAGKSARTAQKTTATAGKATKRAAEQAKKAVAFIVRHKKVVLIVGGLFIITIFLLNTVSSCSVLFQAGIQAVAATTYPSTDEAMLGAEAAYAGMEADLQNEADHYQTLHPGYDEYRYDLDEIWHDPYVLISILTAWQGGEWTLDEVQGTLSMLFAKQYQLTQTVQTEVRYRTETRTGTASYTDPDTGQTTTSTYTYTVQVPYNYTICTVTLHNENLSHLPVYIMSEDKVGMYAMYMSTLGNRPDLFAGYAHASTLQEYTDYDVPEAYLSDPIFAAMLKEAEKYLGYPYVWGGSSPTTSFDCSGFVSWVINHSGWNVGRRSAQGLYNICTPISAAQAKHGDLVFFVGTYDTPGVSHVAIYVGDGMMIQAGDPIGYANINTRYWQSHFYAFGRLPAQ